LQEVLRGEPRSIPQLAKMTGVPAHVVLWNIAALRKYGRVEEAGLDEAGEYYQYRLSKEAAP
jgi:hypothetical protein